MLNFYLLLLTVATLNGMDLSTNISNITTDIQNILDKFHQSDYKLTYEWAAVERVNEKYGELTVSTFKFNRTCTANNVTLFPKVNFGYELDIILQAYRFASNEYRIFPLRLEYNFCESVTKGIMGYKTLFECGNFSCPLRKNVRVHYCNWSPDQSNFPPYIPSGKYMVEMQGMFNSEEVFLTKNYAKISRFLD